MRSLSARRWGLFLSKPDSSRQSIPTYQSVVRACADAMSLPVGRGGLSGVAASLAFLFDDGAAIRAILVDVCAK